MQNESLLGVDLGTKRVGLAISHGVMAEAIRSLDYQDKARFFDSLQKIISEQKIEKIIIGLPLRDGGETDQSRWIRQQSKEIARRLNLKTEFVDEAYSSTEADRFAGDRDSQSARVILEQHLKSHQR